jgi:RNA polymerase sigma-70 factor (ECF subfamily)
MQATDAGVLAVASPEKELASSGAERLEGLATDHYQFVWRCLRRLGVPEPGVDDAAQRVFELAALKITQISHGSERAFLFQTALRVAMSERRNYARRREVMPGVELEELIDPAPLPDAMAEARQRRVHLDRLLDALPMDLRTVFVLFEIEGLASPEIASMLDIPVGTVASRLRRAREIFRDDAARLRKRLEGKGKR